MQLITFSDFSYKSSKHLPEQYTNTILFASDFKIEDFGVMYNFEVRKTNQGKPKLLHGGYEFVMAYSSKKNPLKYWRCRKRCGKKGSCGARAVLQNPGKLVLTKPHNHCGKDFMNMFYEYNNDEYNNEVYNREEFNQDEYNREEYNNAEYTRNEDDNN